MRQSSIRGIDRQRALLCAAVCTFIGVLCFGDPARSDQVSSDALVIELLRKLEERDAVIADLQRRLVVVEQRLNESSARTAASSPETHSATSEPRTQVAAAGETKAPEQKKAAPGTLEVDEDAAERALERSLVQTGVLLLPTYQFEIEPFFTYTRRVDDFPTLLGTGGQLTAATQSIRRNEFDFGLGVRFGLPFDSQLELGLPYRLVDQSVVQSTGFTPATETSSTGSAFGDMQVGLAKTLVREHGWRPDLVARVTWDTDTGQFTDDGVVLGQGFNELRGSLTALKRQDPLAFSASAYYQTTFEKDGIEPGQEFGFGLEAFLAASPETSLRLGLLQSFVDDVRVNGRRVDGSDQVNAVLVLGASSVLGRRTLLDFTAGVGLTDDAPDYFVNVSLPIRYDLPGL